MHSPAKKPRHSVAIFGERIRIGLFRSTQAQARSAGDIASAASRVVSGVDGLSFDDALRHAEAGNERSFEIRLPVAGLTSRLQWRFFGVLLADGSSVLVQGAFRLPRFLEIYFVAWFVAAGLFVALGTVVAATSEMPEMWLLPLAGLVVAAGGYATLFVARAMAEPAMQRVASQLELCLGTGSANSGTTSR